MLILKNRALLQDILKDTHSFGLLPNITISEIGHLPDLISEAGQLDPFFRGLHLERTFSFYGKNFTQL